MVPAARPRLCPVHCGYRAKAAKGGAQAPCTDRPAPGARTRFRFIRSSSANCLWCGRRLSSGWVAPVYLRGGWNWSLLETKL